MASQAEDAAMRRAIALAARGLGPPAPTRSSDASYSTPTARSWGRAATRTRAARTPRSAPLARGRRAGPRRHRRGHPRTVQPHRAHRPLQPGADPAGIARVVAAVADPNPLATGGAATLRAAGVEVESGCGRRGRRGNVAWLTATRRAAAGDPRPFVIWKFASTLDGRSAAPTAPASGSPRRTPGPTCTAARHRRRDHRRRRHRGRRRPAPDRATDAGAPADRQPLRVVVDSDGRTPADARVRDGAAPHLDRDRRRGRRRRGRPGRPAQCSARLYDRGVPAGAAGGRPDPGRGVPGGGLVDKVVGYVAPKLLGAGPRRWPPPASTTIAEAIDLELTDVRRVGPDLRITALPKGS